MFLKPFLTEFQWADLLFQYKHADQFYIFKELLGFMLNLLRRILHFSVVSVMVNIDLEIKYLPPDKLDNGLKFLIELVKSQLSDAEKSKIKMRFLVFLKAAT